MIACNTPGALAPERLLRLNLFNDLRKGSAHSLTRYQPGTSIYNSWASDTGFSADNIFCVYVL